MHIKRWIAFCLVLFFVKSVSAQFEKEEPSNFTSDYINSMFYYGNLDHLRSSFNRSSKLGKVKSEYEHSGSENAGVGAILYDFNYVRNIEGDSKVPMLLGVAGSHKKIGFHALVSTTNMRIFGPGNSWDEKLQEDPKRFQGTSFGLSYNTKWFNVLGDITYAQKNLSYFGQLNIPFIKLRAGIGISKYNQIVDTMGYTTIVQGDAYSPDYYFINSAILRFINVGFSVLSYSEVKLAPHVSFSLYQISKRDKWDGLKYDMEVYFKTFTPGLKQILELKDYETRVTFYYFLGGAIEKERNIEDKSLSTRGAYFASVSYKSGLDYIAETMRKAGVFYSGPKGWGGELGYGIRVLGLKNYGIDDETFLKISLYYNYSEYFEVWPSFIGGIKFRVRL